MNHLAYVALGSNIGEREDNLQTGVNALCLLPGTKVVGASCVYETLPVGFERQRSFYNAVVAVETELSAHAMLGACLGIEAGMGRRRLIKNGPRVLDMDLLLFDDLNISEPELILPHPHMFERGFVMVPLCDICDDEVYQTARKNCDCAGVAKTAFLLEIPG